MSANRSFGVVAREDLLASDGLTFLTRIMEGDLPSPPIFETMGFAFTQLEKGRCVVRGEPGVRFYNPSSQVHGGFALAILDTALGCAIHTMLVAGEGYTTLEIKTNMVRGMTAETGLVHAEGKVLHRGRTTATSEGKLTDANGKLIAHATTTCMIFPPQ
ncbi:PaaI family thioesterase [Tepidamorphus sp. 3E244]|uniref:PaaI family thioesterase n=1 Tax=Tepidamorphus sp. 3E244 TaxID=3385498 RepID=UPI0038FCDBE5